jgi:hypothetical protein
MLLISENYTDFTARSEIIWKIGVAENLNGRKGAMFVSLVIQEKKFRF